MDHNARIRIKKATISGEIMHEGQRAYFRANIDGTRVDAEFDQHPESEQRLNLWELFKLLEKHIDQHWRG